MYRVSRYSNIESKETERKIRNPKQQKKQGTKRRGKPRDCDARTREIRDRKRETHNFKG